MAQTFFHNLLRSHGMSVTVEYQWEDETCVCIVAKWPHTKEYDALITERRALRDSVRAGLCDEFQEKLRELDSLIEDLEESCLSKHEAERIEQWLSENCRHSSDEVRF